MNYLIQSNDLIGSDSQKGAIKEVLGRVLKELKTVKILQQKGIKFSGSKGRARKESPVSYLSRGEEVPGHLKFVVVEKRVNPGNKLWGRIDFLVNHCGYQLIDERSQ